MGWDGVTVLYVYPRLPLVAARARLAKVDQAHKKGGLASVEHLVSFDHSDAAPIPTGGPVADTTQIEKVRLAALDAIEPWRSKGEVNRANVADFDRALGHALHEGLQIIPADAAHDETWNFLTLVVMPDIAVLRFPDMHVGRMTGTSRNALRRAWQREAVLGDLMRAGSHPLGEDELVGLFERSALARNRRLIRILASAVLEYQGRASRSEWARELFKRVTFQTGPRILDGLDDAELDDLIRNEVGLPANFAAHAELRRGAGEADSMKVDVAHPPRGRVDSAVKVELSPTVPVPQERGHTSLEREFSKAMVSIYQKSQRELGYNVTYFLRIVANEGAVATAEKLLSSERVSDRFVRLWERGRLDLSVEALVLDPRYRGLFRETVIQRARQRLELYDFSQ